ncbi:type II secretion system F family protein [Rhizobiales bacterium]|uniref:type II secretion system F family protein n=1 Tax=Hongsoonwoonella zoysiae TaxID=2821844 RepID=UPI00155FFFAD|nr:type II secretion system F family protein [Hongsoonwoonella zoysiae]NRG16129.1 type II secretion system F family protein [Hongsoonwoonella zoysiae]
MNIDVATLASRETLIAVLTTVAVAGTIFTLASPIFEGDRLKSRMKSVALEREKMRARERARMATEKGDARASLRNQPKHQIKQLVDRLNLTKGLANEETRQQLRQAGFRGTAPLYTYLFARVVAPIVLFLAAIVYTFSVLPNDQPAGIKLAIAFGVGIVGFYAPNIYLKNRIQNRQLSINRAWPDALDLMLICVESGMSIESAFRKVADEIGIQSIALAEELTLTNAELSYLGERRKAYENLALRTGVDGVKNVVTALIQAERYGTPVGQAIRVMAEENREQRTQAAEKKAASLPPKLTVPMILFFLPVLFAVIIGPAIIQVLENL